MKRWISVFCLLVALAAPGLVFSDLLQNIPKVSKPQEGIQVYVWTWTGDGSGAFTGSKAYAVTGEVIQVVFVPTSATSPTSGYDTVIYDSNAIDILMGYGANQNAVAGTTCYRTPLNGESQPVYLVDEIIYPVVSNSGATKSGTIYLYIAN